MPTIGFFELLLISVVALLVLGPERLPGAIRTTSLWVGRARRSFNKVKTEIEQQLNADEIRRQLHNESILADLEQAKKQANELAGNANRALKKLSSDVESTVHPEATPSAAKTAAPAILPPAAVETGEKAPAAPADAEPDTAGSPVTPDAPDSADTPISPAARTPVQDFYNNPGISTVELHGGAVKPLQPTEPTAAPGAPDQSVKK
jgi:sec-independent protein translocase protein TatB